MKLAKLFFVILVYAALYSCSKDSNVGSGVGIGGSTARMTISGNYLYMVTSQKLYTYDISNPSQFLLVETQNIGWDAETIFPYQDKLFIGRQTGMYVFDISNPRQPVLKGQAQHFRACDPVVADDTYAYITLRSNNNFCGGAQNELVIYDIKGQNLLIPRMVSNLAMPQPNGLGLKGNTLFICMGSAGMNVVDVTDRRVPKIIKTIKSDEDFIDVIPYDNTLIVYVKGGILLYDISNPVDPKLLSSIKN